MKNLFTIAILAFVLAFSAPAYSQATLPQTTISAAVADAKTQVIAMTSVTANSVTLAPNMIIVIDQEMMTVAPTYVSGLNVNVVRGTNKTTAMPHASGAFVFYGPTNYFYSRQPPGGACTTTAQLVLPFVTINNDSKRIELYNCQGGVWYLQTMPNAQPVTLTKYCSVPVGSVAYASMGTSTTLVSGTIFVASIDLPKSVSLTGVTTLVNGTVATDKLIGALYSSDGTLLANSAVAGTITAGANTFNDLAFTSTYLATGPARYFIAIQGNGTTDGIRTVAASTFINLIGNSRTGTFATLPAITVPTTLTANTAPIACVY